MDNLATVQRIYEAFGRGDVPAILEHLAEDVEWDYGSTADDVPWLRTRRGRDEVPRFFEALQRLELRRFDVKHLLADGEVVVAVIDFEAVVRETGATIREEDEGHLWRFREGRVVRFRHLADTLMHHRAFRGERGSGPA